MVSNSLKILAQKAKKRLCSVAKSQGEAQNEKTTFAYLAQNNYALVASKQIIEEDPLFDKVKKLLEKDEVTNPISMLIDKEIFENLDSKDKERYVLDISKRYLKIKEYFENHKCE